MLFSSIFSDVFPEEMLQETQETAHSLLSSTSVSTQSSMHDLRDVFQASYQHLRQKQYVDDIVRALYIDHGGPSIMSKIQRGILQHEVNPFSKFTRATVPSCEGKLIKTGTIGTAA